MERKKYFISLKMKIMLLTLIPVIISFILICAVTFVTLFNSLRETAKAEFLQICQKNAVSFEGKINHALDYLSIVSNTLELRVLAGTADRELLRDTVFYLFDNYELVDGSSVYFEPNAYDGRDAEYIGTEYGTALSGRICYYFYKDGETTAYLPEALENDIEFELPHYANAKKTNKPIYTEPAVYEVDGKIIPMFTLTYPVRDRDSNFIGAVTVDLFLEDIYEQIQNEQIYETGYVIIANDQDQVIYSPIFDDIGKKRTDVGLDYPLPQGDETSSFSNAKSIINGKETLVAVERIYIPRLDSSFYISASAPTVEIDAAGTRQILALVAFSVFIILLIALLLYYLIGRVSAPIKQITENANKIANGDIDEAFAFDLSENNSRIIDEVNTLSVAIKKMLSQLNQIQGLKLKALEMQHEKEKAESAAKAKSDFLARMSHEIRTPMNAVMGMTELILRKNLPPSVYEDALMIKNASANLLSIINDILDFSKIESGMLEIIETEYMLPSLINDIIGIIKIRLVDKPVLFSAYIAPDIPASLIGDEIRIRQTLINLLNNAVKYTSEGTISLSVTGEIIDDTVTLIFEISDSGVGIKEEDIDKLFGDFVQIDAQSNKGIEGTGLGLAISRSLCLAMGGDITVRSQYGEGSVFTVTLPQGVKSREPFAVVCEPENKAVLIYETRDVYADSIIKSLDSLGVKYQKASSIPSLFENIEKYPYIFVSSFAHGSIRPTLSRLKSPPCLVLLADVTEAATPKDARVLALPTHALSIANVLNDVFEAYDSKPVTGASFAAPEARVLIVDDVKANLKVGEGLLLPYDTQITLCDSGIKAVELVAENEYDLIFMDHMMPEMDGIEATGLIRAMEGDYYKNIPIVALTANAISGVREMFIQHGMNDFLAKPIETAKLDAIMQKWIPKEKRMKAREAEQPDERNEFVERLKAVPELNVNKALMVVGGSASTYERIIRLSARLLPENIERLNSLIDTDLHNYSIEVHGIKGVLNNMGAYELGLMANELENCSKNGDADACAALHPGFIYKLADFSETMTILSDESDIADKELGDITFLADVIEKLYEATDYCDSVMALEALSPVSQMTFGSDIDTILDRLLHSYERFDFDRAEELLVALKGKVEYNG